MPRKSSHDKSGCRLMVTLSTTVCEWLEVLADDAFRTPPQHASYLLQQAIVAEAASPKSSNAVRVETPHGADLLLPVEDGT